MPDGDYSHGDRAKCSWRDLARTVAAVLWLVTAAPTAFSESEVASVAAARTVPDVSRSAGAPTLTVTPEAAAWLSLRDEAAVGGRAQAAGGDAAPDGAALAVATADLDEDGVTDLISAHADFTTGALVVRRGNAGYLFPAWSRAPDGSPVQVPASAFTGGTLRAELPVRPDLLACGDWNADGHIDAVVAARGEARLWWLAGDGAGGLGEPAALAVPGRVSTLVAGEVNRADGLADLVVGVDGPDGPAVLVYESPGGALAGSPEMFPAAGEVVAIATGQLDLGYPYDIAIAAGSELVVISGRDRALSLDHERRAAVEPPRVERRALGAPAFALAVGRFGGAAGQQVAVLTEAGELVVLAPGDGTAALADWREERWTVQAPRGPVALARANVSRWPADDLILVGGGAGASLLHLGEVQVATARAAGGGARPLAAVTFHGAAAPPALLAVRLNGDAFDDLVLFAEDGEPRVLATAAAATFVVNDPCDAPDSGSGDGICKTDAGTCTLRAALTQNNSGSGGNLVTFGVAAVNTTTNMTLVSKPVTIDGTSQGKVQINGEYAEIRISGGSSTVRGVAVPYVAFIKSGPSNNGGNRLEGSHVGLNAAGTATVAVTGGLGIMINTADNWVGGAAAAARNVIARGTTGVCVTVTSATATGNRILGNFIGTDVTGTQDLTAGEGVNVTTSAAGTVIGGTEAGARNVIAGASSGIGVGYQASGTLVQGNWIGTTAGGAAPLPNAYGISLGNNAGATTIGGTTPAARNVISGNSQDGINVQSAAGLVVQGNYLGLNAAGNASLGNGSDGIENRAAGTAIGGVAAGSGNVISGNKALGVFLAAGVGATVQGNRIGTDAAGAQAIGNGTPGSASWGDGVHVQAADVVIGGVEAGAGNVISGNVDDGIDVNLGTAGARVLGNRIGTAADGTTALGNGGDGVFLNANGTTIGVDAANTIASNGGRGVWVGGGTGNRVRRNSIHANGALGIDLVGTLGVTPNDPGDGDVGGNGLQNFPVLSGVTGGSATGSLASTPNTAFTLDFYASPVCDPSGNGEGKTYLGSTGTTTDGTGSASFSFAVGGASGVITATATDPDGNTSEFSACAAPGSEPVRQVKVTPAAATVQAGGTVNLSVEMLKDGVRDTAFAGSVTLRFGPGGTAGVGRLQVGSGPIGAQVTVPLAAGLGAAKLLTPGTALTAATVITPATVLAGTAALLAEAAGASSGGASVAVTTPLDLRIDRIEAMQGARVSPLDRMVRGRPLWVRVFVADGGTAPYAAIEGLSGRLHVTTTGGAPIAESPFPLRNARRVDSSLGPEPYVHRRSFTAEQRLRGENAFNVRLDFDPALLALRAELDAVYPDLNAGDNSRPHGPLTAEYSQPLTLLVARTRYVKDGVETQFPSHAAVDAIERYFWLSYPVTVDRLRVERQPDEVVSGDVLVTSRLRELAFWRGRQRGADVVGWVYLVGDDFLKLTGRDRVAGVANRLGGSIAIANAATCAAPRWECNVLSHEVGHLLGLGDTYADSAHEVADVNPRRAESPADGNYVEDGTYEWFSPRYATSDHPSIRLTDYMGVSKNLTSTDQASWDHLRERFMPVEVQGARAAGPAVVVRGAIPRGGGGRLDACFTMDGIESSSGSASGSHVVETLDAGGKALASLAFTPDFRVTDSDKELEEHAFDVALPFSPSVSTIRLRNGAAVLVARAVSAAPPTASFVTNLAGQTVAAPIQVTWQGSDPDGDPLLYSLMYSPDGELHLPLLADSAATSFTWDPRPYPSGAAPRLVLAATDGVRATFVESPLLTVPDRPPRVSILQPADGLAVPVGAQVVLEGSVNDPEEGLAEAPEITWTSSRDGALGVGPGIATSALSAGAHTITASGRDSVGREGTAAVTITVTSGPVCALQCEPLAPVSVPYGVPAAFVAGVTASDCAAPVSTEWELGDGGSAVVADPTHAYTTLGPHGWRLIAASGPYWCEAGGTILVTPPTARAFDLGTAGSPLAPGHTRVSDASTYAAVRGFGWAAGTLAARDRGGDAGALLRDFVFTGLAAFRVDIPDGTYDLTVTMGDASAAHDRMGLLLDGAPLDEASTGAGEFVLRSYRIATFGGAFELGLDDRGGSDGNVVLNAVAVKPPGAERFDFGTATSPVEPGYARVEPATAYTPERGYGWLSGTRDARSRSGGSDLTRDFVFTRAATFGVDVAPREWDVTVALGDTAARHDAMTIRLEGAVLDEVSTATGEVATRRFRVPVRDGQLTVELEDRGGSDAYAVINGLAIAPAPGARFDFGTAASPVGWGYRRVDAATAYDAGLGFGWLAGARAERDRGAGDELTRDFIFSGAATFGVDVPDGLYDVTVTMGDATGAHDEMGVFLEGTAVAAITTPAGAYDIRTYRVAVGDGQLTVTLDDLGGADPNAVINALAVAAALPGSPPPPRPPRRRVLSGP